VRSGQNPAVSTQGNENSVGLRGISLHLAARARVENPPTLGQIILKNQLCSGNQNGANLIKTEF